MRSRAIARARSLRSRRPSGSVEKPGSCSDPLVAAWLRSHIDEDPRAETEHGTGDEPAVRVRRAAAERELADLGVQVPRRFVRVVAPSFERWLPPEPSVRR
jgi:hypothetical protein